VPAADRREGAAELGGVLSVQSGVRHDAAAARVGLLHVQWPRALPRGQGVHGVAGAHARAHHGAWRVRRFISSLPISLPHPPHSPPTCEALQYRVYHVAALSFSLSSPRRRRAEVRLLPPCQPNARGDCVHCTPLQETIRHGLAEAQMPPMPWWVLSPTTQVRAGVRAEPAGVATAVAGGGAGGRGGGGDGRAAPAAAPAARALPTRGAHSGQAPGTPAAHNSLSHIYNSSVESQASGALPHPSMGGAEASL